jgi:hypothetical protein
VYCYAFDRHPSPKACGTPRHFEIIRNKLPCNTCCAQQQQPSRSMHSAGTHTTRRSAVGTKAMYKQHVHCVCSVRAAWHWLYCCRCCACRDPILIRCCCVRRIPNQPVVSHHTTPDSQHTPRQSIAVSTGQVKSTLTQTHSTARKIEAEDTCRFLHTMPKAHTITTSGQGPQLCEHQP